MNALLITGSVFLFVAAVVHLLIFFMESVLWSNPKVWQRFGVRSQADADTLKPVMYNQGYYNVFLALGAGVGLVMMGSDNWVQGGIALAMFAGVSMLLAAIVLVTSNRTLWRAAVVQGAAPLLGVLFLTLFLIA